MSIQDKLKIVSPSIFLEEAHPWKSFTVVIIAISSIFILLLFWAMFADINESAVAFGQVEPESKVAVVEHSDGGVVKSVQVQNGDLVKQGQALIELNISKADAQLKQLLMRRTYLRLDQIRLTALKSGKNIKNTDWKAAFLGHLQLSEKKQLKLVSEESETFQQESYSHLQKIETIKEQVNKYKTDINRYQKQVQTSKENLSLYQQELKMFEESLKHYYVSKRDYLILKRKTNETESSYVAMQSSLAFAQSQVREYEAKLQQEKSHFTNELQQKIDTINRQLAELEQQLVPLQAEVVRYAVKAPINGFVSKLTLKPDSVISPGDKLLEIVPDTPFLIVNARLSTRDIGHVSVGDKAKIKVLTYDYAKFGDIAGKVAYISATTYYTDKNVPYYEAYIKPEKNYVGSNKNFQIKSGMTAQVDIITGKKTILNYLLGPIQASASHAMSER